MLKLISFLSSLLVLHYSYCNSQSAFDLPRGVHPELASFYSDGDTFQCLDGTKSIPFNQLNDDYCDCEDGSDEPGTAACSKGQFYCTNKGHAAKILDSSRVNDGICDCCDGSDEWLLENNCADTCEEMGTAARLQAERDAVTQEEGFALKQSLIREGKEMKARRLAEVEKLKKELELAQELQLDKEETKLTAEEAEKEALDRHRAVQDKLREEMEAQERLEDAAKATSTFEGLDMDHNGKIDGAEIAVSSLFDQNKDGSVSQEEAAFFMSEKEEFTQDDFVATVWPLVKIRLNENQNVSQPEDEVSKEEKPVDSEEKDDSKVVEKEEPPSIGKVSYDISYDEATQALVDAAQKARSEFEAVRNEAKDLEDRVKALEKSLAKDYGTEDEYAAFADKCVELTDLEYTYKICLFDQCSQQNKLGGSHTTLGNWEKWDGEDMLFTGGQQCWNGPSRSTRVHVKCAVEARLVSVSEPSKCEYEMVLEIPSACRNPKEEQQRHDEL